MKGRLGDKVRLQHILDAIDEVEHYLDDVSYDQFLSNSEKRFATIKQIEIVGEACNALSDELKANHSSVPWKAIIGFRNISIHEYFGKPATGMGDRKERSAGIEEKYESYFSRNS